MTLWLSSLLSNLHVPLDVQPEQTRFAPASGPTRSGVVSPYVVTLSPRLFPSPPPLLQGHDASTHALATFGGAGPQHCCAMARALGMSNILVSRFSGVLSAYGLSAADVVCEKQEACAAEYGDGGEGPPEVRGGSEEGGRGWVRWLLHGLKRLFVVYAVSLSRLLVYGRWGTSSRRRV